MTFSRAAQCSWVVRGKMCLLFAGLLLLLRFHTVMPQSPPNDVCSISNVTMAEMNGTLEYIGGHLVFVKELASGEYTLRCAMTLEIVPYQFEGHYSTMCLNLVKGTVDSSLGGELVARATVMTDRRIPVGILIINNTCWTTTTQFLPCRTSAVIAQSVTDTGIFLHSPLTEQFWSSMKDEHLFQPGWILKLTTETFHGSISSSWLATFGVTSLQELFVSGNRWGRVDTLLPVLSNLSRLFLMNNSITELPSDTFKNLTRVQYVHLQLNNLTVLPPLSPNVRVLDLNHQEAITPLTIPDEVIPTLSGMEELQISTPIRENIVRLWSLPRLRSFTCRRCIITDISTYSETFNRNTALTSIRLTSNKLTSLPAMVFKNITALSQLYLDDNLFEKCPCDSLKNKPNLRTLDLSTNKIQYIDSHCLSELVKLSKLNLSNNEITQIQSSLFNNITSLRYLYLSQNHISKIDDHTFLHMNLLHLYLASNQLKDIPALGRGFISILDVSNNSLIKLNVTAGSVGRLDLSRNRITQLECGRVNVLNLSYNSLSSIPESVWPSLGNVSTLDIGGNQFQCCHNNFTRLQSLVNASSTLIRNLSTNTSLVCLPNSGPATVLLMSFTNHETLCAVFVSRLGVELGVPLAVLVLCILLFAAVARSSLFQLSYLHYFLRLKRKDQLQPSGVHYVYDAFLCYSENDFAWVAQQLLPNLETGPDSFRFCLQDRDFTPGVSIDKNIATALKKSRRVILILSKNFLTSTWCQWELNLASHKMLRENRNYIILIQLEPLARKELPVHMRMLMESRMYLEWPQDSADEHRINRCWQRLRSSLGSSVQKRTGAYVPMGTLLDI